MTINFSSEIMEARRNWHSMCPLLKEKDYQPRNLWSVKIFFSNEEEIKIFSNEKNKTKPKSKRSCYYQNKAKRMAKRNSEISEMENRKAIDKNQ